MLSKSMDSSYEPLILKKMKTSTDQFGVEQSSLHVGGIMPMDSELVEPRVSPTNTAEKCRRILSRTSEKSRVLFAVKGDSPSEKSKMLTTPPSKSSLWFAGEKCYSPLEKSNILVQDLAENALQFAAKRDSPSDKSKMPATQGERTLGFAGGNDSPLEKIKSDRPSEKRKFSFSDPLPSFQSADWTKKARVEYQPFDVEGYIKDILASRKGENGDPFLGWKSVFSFL